MRLPLHQVLSAVLAVAACSDQGGAPLIDGGIAADVSGDEWTGDGPLPGPQAPALLSETGLYSDFGAETLAEGVLPYQVRYELWADGAEKSRFLLLPPGEAIDNSNPDAWTFPVGTRAWKDFRVGGERIETRYMEKFGPDRLDWLRMAYVWRADGTDADAAPEGLRDASGTTHDVPSPPQCYQCHNGAADNLIGIAAYQIGAPDGDGTMAALQDAGRFVTPPAASYVVPGTGVVQGALAYLHSNCGHCHSNYHYIADIRLLRLWLPVGLTAPEDAPVYSTATGLTMYHVVEGTTVALVPGDPDASQLYVRMTLRDGNQMPQIGTEIVDTTATSVVRSWIEGM